MITGFSDVSPSPKTNLVIFGDTRTPKENKENPWDILKKISLINLEIWGIQNFVDLEKDGHRKMIKIRLIKS